MIKKLAAEGAAQLLAAGPLSGRVLKNALAVFLYHEVSDSPSEFNRLFNLTVSPGSFSKQLDLIRERFHVIGPRELLSGDYPRPAALVTFDDGNRSYFTEALPILRAKKIPSVAFLNMGPILGEVCWSGLVTYLQVRETGFVSRNGRRPAGNEFRNLSEEEVRPYLEKNPGLEERIRLFRGPLASEADLRAAAADPLVSLGNHLYNHYNATLLSNRLREEYRENQRLLAGYSDGSRLVSYPFGCWTPATSRLLIEEGAQALFAGGNFPNFGGRGALYHRVELGDSIIHDSQLRHALLRNLLPAVIRRQTTWS